MRNIPKEFIDIIINFKKSQLINTFLKLEIADILYEKPLTLIELSEKLSLNPNKLKRIIRGFLFCDLLYFENNKLNLTEKGQFFCSTENNGEIEWLYSQLDIHYKVWGELSESLYNDEIAFEKIFKTSFFEYNNKSPKLSNYFQTNMSNNSILISENLLSIYPMDNISNIIDIGGGDGTLLLEILKKYSNIDGYVFEKSNVEHLIKNNIINSNINRLNYIKGNFFESIPQNFDLYILKLILHDWDDTNAIKVLKNCREAMNSNSKLIIIEYVIPDDFTTDQYYISMDIAMFLLLGGQERTLTEYQNLLTSANLSLDFSKPLGYGCHIIQASIL